VDQILDAAYECLNRHGVQKTTMDDIAKAAGMSRPAVYQYVRNKEDVFRRLAARIFDAGLARARAAAADGGTLAQRLDRILAVRLAMTQLNGSPHARELIGPGAAVSADLDRAFVDDLADLVTATITDAAAQADLSLRDTDAREIAELVLALTRGLQADLSDSAALLGSAGVADSSALAGSAGVAGLDRTRERLRDGVALIVAGLAATAQPAAH
jgi:TetR/AcrR family transcriptional regulator